MAREAGAGPQRSESGQRSETGRESDEAAAPHATVPSASETRDEAMGAVAQQLRVPPGGSLRTRLEPLRGSVHGCSESLHSIGDVGTLAYLVSVTEESR